MRLQPSPSNVRELLGFALATVIPVWAFLIPFALLAVAQTSLRDADALSLSVAALLAAPVAIALAWYASRQHSRRPLGLIVALGLAGVVVEAYLIVFG